MSKRFFIKRVHHHRLDGLILGLLCAMKPPTRPGHSNLLMTTDYHDTLFQGMGTRLSCPSHCYNQLGVTNCFFMSVHIGGIGRLTSDAPGPVSSLQLNFLHVRGLGSRFLAIAVRTSASQILNLPPVSQSGCLILSPIPSIGVT